MFLKGLGLEKVLNLTKPAETLSNSPVFKLQVVNPSGCMCVDEM